MQLIDGDCSYHIEERLHKKLLLLEERCTRKKQKQNSYIIVHGPTGDGKTNTSLIIAHHAKLNTNRKVHLFFRLQPLIDFEKKNDEAIVIYDEPSLDALSTDSLTTLNRDFFRLINTGRKKRHYNIINLTKFWKFSEELVVDTALGFVHMNTKGGSDPGRFVYIRQKNLEKLWNDYKTHKKRNYIRYKSFGGWFPLIEQYYDKLDITLHGKDGEIIEHSTFKDYEMMKDKAIESIGDNKKISKRELQYQRSLIELRRKVAGLWLKGVFSQLELAGKLGISPVRLREWAKMDSNDPISLEKSGFEASKSPTIINTWGDQDDGLDVPEEEKQVIKKSKSLPKINVIREVEAEPSAEIGSTIY